MQIDVITLFPDMLAAVTDHGITGRAVRQDLVTIDCLNPRDFTEDKHRTVDDRPYGGGPGMVMKIEPLRKAIDAARAKSGGSAKVIYLSPQGRQLDQAGVEELSSRERIILIAGRYEGIDERLIDSEVDEEWSIGDYVLSGGELAAMVMIDAVVRQLPGALGHEQSAREDSFAEGLLDCPHFTRPEIYQGRPVPDVLLSGDHENIRRWRLKQALGRTWLRRRDLIESRELTTEEAELLASFIAESASD
ncbi:tRNA (guanine-N(1)-)-methyltransferase [marine gamma proteobacterium HTCC2143]|jgi:tRNA (guanine37-N1)-methyltransferase|uniref:tRNA (guanine-N(1)-)-methyltransferase n=1 Tax=marine gamma proteobacterium HTCC2143 TaxID=247633 RepID=A0YHP5_9GAMM|nr:tRNA (guanine-N(1)-)-methyltransferase [marine gamma proteobacterium HTCC2143]